MAPRGILGAVLAGASVAPAASVALVGLRGRGESVLSGETDSSLRPEVVAQLFGEVAKSWVQARTISAEDAADANSAQKWAVASCGKVAGAVIKGSDGEVKKVREYMQVVCSKAELLQGNEDLCLSFAAGLEGAMHGDGVFNRGIDPVPFCAGFYTGPVESAAKVALAAQADERRAADEAETAKKAEEAKARAKEAERLKNLEAEASAEAERLGDTLAKAPGSAAVDTPAVAAAPAITVSEVVPAPDEPAEQANATLATADPAAAAAPAEPNATSTTAVSVRIVNVTSVSRPGSAAPAEVAVASAEPAAGGGDAPKAGIASATRFVGFRGNSVSTAVGDESKASDEQATVASAGAAAK